VFADVTSQSAELNCSTRRKAEFVATFVVLTLQVILYLVEGFAGFMYF